MAFIVSENIERRKFSVCVLQTITKFLQTEVLTRYTLATAGTAVQR
jgi:hypothetical protein